MGYSGKGASSEGGGAALEGDYSRMELLWKGGCSGRGLLWKMASRVYTLLMLSTIEWLWVHTKADLTRYDQKAG